MAERSGAGIASPPGRGAAISPLGEIAWLFLKLGTTAFGGPAAHIAMMQDEVVRRRGWLSNQEFLDLLGATNMIPGPNSTEMAIHIGWHRARWAGLVVAGVCFILPATLIVTALAAAYVRYGTRPAAEGLLYGIKPVMIAIVAQAIWRLAPTALKSPALIALTALVIALSLLGSHELLLLAGGGLGAAAIHLARSRRRPDAGGTACLGILVAPLAAGPATAAAAATVAPFGLLPLFFFFLKVGSVLFGSGYVLLAFLRSDLVERYGWLTEAQLLDAIAIGQFTPGPVFTTATFIGYLLGGIPGASVATAGIFLPAFAFVAALGPLVPRLRRSATAAAVLDGLNAASLALMAAVTWQLGRAAIIDAPTLGLAAIGAVLLVRYRVNTTWLILGGAVAGLALTAAGMR
jgi:chromate transporter